SRTFGERSVAVVPEKLVVGLGRDQEVGVAVAVEVRCHAALPADLEVGMRLLADVHERAPYVVEERATRQSTVLLPPTSIRIGERVDDEQVEPAVPVVVEPADTSPHHGGQVVGDSEAEGSLAEVEPDLRRDVLEPDIGERPCRADDGSMHGGQRRRRRRRPSDSDDDVVALLESHLDGLLEGRRVVSNRELRWSAAIDGDLLEALDRGKDPGRCLARCARQRQAYARDSIARDRDRSAGGSSDLLAEIDEPRTTGTGRRPLWVAEPERSRIGPEVQDDVACDLFRSRLIDAP